MFKQKKCYKFEGYATFKVSGYVYAEDAEKAHDNILYGSSWMDNYEIEDYTPLDVEEVTELGEVAMEDED